jgi:hypothetical protein
MRVKKTENVTVKVTKFGRHINRGLAGILRCRLGHERILAKKSGLRCKTGMVGENWTLNAGEPSHF